MKLRSWKARVVELAGATAYPACASTPFLATAWRSLLNATDKILPSGICFSGSPPQVEQVPGLSEMLIKGICALENNIKSYRQNAVERLCGLSCRNGIRVFRWLALRHQREPSSSMPTMLRL